MSENEEIIIDNINQIRPPNPYDFSSICDFLEKVLHLDGIYNDYKKMTSIIESRINEKSGGAKKTSIKIFDEEAFENALIRTLFLLSTALIKFKQLSPAEQNTQRDTLHRKNSGNVANALTYSGFPESFGKTVIGKTIAELESYNLFKALHKAEAIFHRSFYFVVKENDLTRKSLEDLVKSIRQATDMNDLRVYLETLVYKVEIASTENAFNSMKRMISGPLEDFLEELKKSIENKEEGPVKSKEMAEKAELIEQYNTEYFSEMQSKSEILKDFCGQYFSSNDFIFVEKNLLQFKKATTEKVVRRATAILPDEFVAMVDRKLTIQLISAMKRLYNQRELMLIKAFMLKDLLSRRSEDDATFQMRAQNKKKIILDALKRIKNDMVLEDAFNTATINKRKFLEDFEKELLTFNYKMLETQSLVQAANVSEDLLTGARTSIKKHVDKKEKEKEIARKFMHNIDFIGSDTMKVIFSLYAYHTQFAAEKDFKKYVHELEPQAKHLETTIKQIDVPEKKEEKKRTIFTYLTNFQEHSQSIGEIDNESERLFQHYLKGLVDRIQYW